MASIAKRPNGQWRARYRDAYGKEHARHFVRKIDAQNWLDSVTTAVQTGIYVDPNRGKVTIEEWATRWPEGQAHLKPSTHERAMPASCAYTSCRSGLRRDSSMSRTPGRRRG